jgi:hypothetical protein
MTYITLFNCMVVFHYVFTSDVGLHYLTFMRRNLKIKKKLTRVQIMNNADMNSNNNMNIVDNFNE